MSSNIKNDEEKEILFTGRGILLFTVLSLHDMECNQIKVRQLMQEFCKKMSMNGYGKPALVILREVLSITKDQMEHWVESVYDKYICDNDVFSIFNSLSATLPRGSNYDYL